MSGLSLPSLESATGPKAEFYSQIKKAISNVQNAFVAIGAHGPAALKALLSGDAVLAAGNLSKCDRETIKAVISAVAGCDYCVAAHGLLDKLAGLKPNELKKIHNGEPTGDAQPAALIRLSARSRKSAAPSAMTIAQQSKPPATATGGWWTSVLPLRRPPSPTSSIASTTPTSTSQGGAD
jgi:AhpD family alkylhydroperoxidase